MSASRGRSDIETFGPAYEDEVPAFTEIVMELLGVRYGGIWIDHLPTGDILNVGVVSPTSSDILAIKAQAPQEVITEVRPVQFSSEDLQGFALALVDYAHDHPDTILDIGPSPDINKVEVRMSAPDAPLVVDMQTKVPLGALQVTIIQGAQWEAAWDEPSA